MSITVNIRYSGKNGLTNRTIKIFKPAEQEKKQ